MDVSPARTGRFRWLSLNLAIVQTSVREFVTIQTHAIVLVQSFDHLPYFFLRVLSPCVRLSDGELVPCLHRAQGQGQPVLASPQCPSLYLVLFLIAPCGLPVHVSWKPSHLGRRPSIFTSPDHACRHEPPT